MVLFSCSTTEEQTIVTPDGMNLWLNQPNSYFFNGEYKRTYFAFSNSKGEVAVKFYDHDTNVMSSEKIIHKFDSSDDHSSPSILVIDSGAKKGHIVLSFSHHSSPMLFSISKKPESIAEFEQPKVIVSDRTTYPSLFQNKVGHMKIFFRGHPKVKSYTKGIFQSIKSTDNGISWSTPTTIIEFDDSEYIYPIVTQRNFNEIGVSWSVLNTGSKVYSDIYYSKSFDFGKTWLTKDDQFIDTLQKESSKRIVEDSQIRIIDIAITAPKKYMISAVKYEDEFDCCKKTAQGIILNERNKRINFETKIDYYATGASFSKNDPNTIYFPRKNTHGGNDIYQGIINDNFELNSSKLINGRERLLTRPVSVSKTVKNNLIYLDIKKYESYLDFTSEIWFYQHN